VSDTALTRPQAFVLFAIVVLAWGLIWPVMKVLVESVPPLWTNALRCWIALVALVCILGATRSLVVPTRADAPVVASIALLHMVGFSVLMAAGLLHVPASKAIVLGYTTPLWVTLLAPVFLRERLTPGRLAGAALGLVGLGVLLNPASLDWTDRHALLGYAYILAAALLWAASIVYARKHRWIATPLQLLPWQIALAGAVLTPLAFVVEGVPHVDWTATLVSLFAFAGLVGTALGYWAMSMVNRSLPALTTSLGITATPIVGIAGGALLLGERLDVSLLVAAALIIGGIVVNSLCDRR
jgi:drug/metabolite transporter (DMT)-like permease